MTIKHKRGGKTTKKPGLNPKQIRFCEEYVIDLNATDAYRRAGYKVKSADVAGVNAARLLADARVQAKVVEFQRLRQERLQIDQDYVLKRLKIEAEFCGDGASHAARIRAVELMGKHICMFPEQVDHHHTGHTTHAHAHAHTLIDTLPLQLRIQILQHLKQTGKIDIGGPDAEEPTHANQLGEGDTRPQGGTPLAGHDTEVFPRPALAQTRVSDSLPSQRSSSPVAESNGTHTPPERGPVPPAR